MYGKDKLAKIIFSINENDPLIQIKQNNEWINFPPQNNTDIPNWIDH
jgi:hypothetical protein